MNWMLIMVYLRVHLFIQPLIFIAFHSVCVMNRLIYSSRMKWISIYIVAEIMTRRMRRRGGSRPWEDFIIRYVLYAIIKKLLANQDTSQTILCSILEGHMREVGDFYACNLIFAVFTSYKVVIFIFLLQLLLFDNRLMFAQTIAHIEASDISLIENGHPFKKFYYYTGFKATIF